MPDTGRFLADEPLRYAIMQQTKFLDPKYELVNAKRLKERYLSTLTKSSKQNSSFKKHLKHLF